MDCFGLFLTILGPFAPITGLSSTIWGLCLACFLTPPPKNNDLARPLGPPQFFCMNISDMQGSTSCSKIAPVLLNHPRMFFSIPHTIVWGFSLDPNYQPLNRYLHASLMRLFIYCMHVHPKEHQRRVVHRQFPPILRPS